eukprot:CAMPEP_0194053240 /NCGR_PEP_ID=MMETSP0009_2-20130614/48875_1 /TAXON_ID=210454 /ORGANISM="Grammatophora oceanica, Strain CCMP 410" /LENGTH=231 /DNA_ID=CAMNT_0038701211 /DNA_START=33 /DNA_END=728 /DNA_ORIENTATION=+
MEGLSLDCDAVLPTVVLFSFDGNTPEILNAKERATIVCMEAAKQGDYSLVSLIHDGTTIETLLDRLNGNVNGQPPPQYKFVLPDEKKYPGSTISKLKTSYFDVVIKKSVLKDLTEQIAARGAVIAKLEEEQKAATGAVQEAAVLAKQKGAVLAKQKEQNAAMDTMIAGLIDGLNSLFKQDCAEGAVIIAKLEEQVAARKTVSAIQNAMIAGWNALNAEQKQNETSLENKLE